ncbi:transmembrane ascorbate ferrireductase 1-like [Bidens hawaiensis]|uniref:transmembrane ascorbate ferrireductase 1-like n=1 Tax=Bidens hawaiensis TaxID=980011 RepID=UPI00404AD126
MGLQFNALHLSYVVHVLGVAGAVMVLVWNISFRGGLAWESSNKNLIFNVHPVLMLIGLVILGGEAIISYKALPFKKAEKKLIHLILHAIALVLGIIGIYMAFKNHNESGIANVYSLHSWLGEEPVSVSSLGIGIIVLYDIQWIYGFLVFFYPGGTADLKKESLPWHVLFGIFLYTLVVANSALGFLEKLTFLESSGIEKYGSEAFLVNFTAIVAILYGTFVLLTALSRGPEEDNHSYSAI